MVEGILLVCIVLFAFIGNARGALLVAMSIPFSLLVASICLDVRHVPASLLALGALNLGMTVDGAVVIVENVAKRLSGETGVRTIIRERISDGAREAQRPVFYAAAIILTGYLPISTLQGALGRPFRSIALTEAYVLLGAVLLFLIVAPIVSSAAKRRARISIFYGTGYQVSGRWHDRHRWAIGAVVFVLFAGALYLDLAHFVGSEFLAQLGERSSWTQVAAQ